MIKIKFCGFELNIKFEHIDLSLIVRKHSNWVLFYFIYWLLKDSNASDVILYNEIVHFVHGEIQTSLDEIKALRLWWN